LRQQNNETIGACVYKLKTSVAI